MSSTLTNNRLAEPDAGPRTADLGDEMHHLVRRLYPICRSITGDGVRETLEVLREQIPLEVHEVPTGTQVFDWTVPREWNIHDAYIKNLHGDRVVDFRKCNLHVVSYSLPVDRRVTREELIDHVHTLPDQPTLVPYRTSYYHETWGFCLSQNQLDALSDNEYDVCIDSTLADGSLTYGEYFLPGRVSDEVLISSHVCHPSLCNDNLSGIALATALARHLASCQRHYSYRFLFIPGTIGSITWLSRNRDRVDQIKHGLVVTCVGDSGSITYKRSRQGDAEIDRAVEHVLKCSGSAHTIVDFSPYGYDERQYCSPGFNLPVGCLMRSPHGEFSEYHTSADNLEFVRPQHLADSFSCLTRAIDILEHNRTYRNLSPYGEPHLGRRGLYSGVGGASKARNLQVVMLWVLNLSDCEHSLLDIADRSGFDFGLVKEAADALTSVGLLRVEALPGALRA